MKHFAPTRDYRETRRPKAQTEGLANVVKLTIGGFGSKHITQRDVLEAALLSYIVIIWL